MSYIKYAVLAAIVVVAGTLIFFSPAKESIQGWTTVIPEETSIPPNPPNPILCPTGQHSNGTECVADSNTNTTFSASPISGSAPFEASFVYPPGGNIDFGDGVSSEPCNTSHVGPCTTSHTYTKAGTYIAKYPKIYECADPCDIKQQTVTITVTDGVNVTDFLSHSPM